MNGQQLPSDFQSHTYGTPSFHDDLWLMCALFDSGYCQQMDTHLPTTTVREALMFSARMRQPQSIPDKEKET